MNDFTNLLEAMARELIAPGTADGGAESSPPSLRNSVSVTVDAMSMPISPCVSITLRSSAAPSAMDSTCSASSSAAELMVTLPTWASVARRCTLPSISEVDARSRICFNSSASAATYTISRRTWCSDGTGRP